MTTKISVKVREEKNFPLEYVMEPPVEKGVVIIKYGWVKAGDINYKHKNLGRALGSRNEAHVLVFKKIFNEGLYNPFHNEPIIIEPNGDLVCGRHRTEGALLSDEGKDTLVWVCIMEFANTKVRKQYAIKENINTQKPKLIADEDDIISNIHAAVKDGDCNPNQNAIRTYLNEIAPYIEGKQSIIDAVMKLVNSNYETQDPPTREEIIEYLEDEGIMTSQNTNWRISTLRAGKGEVAGDRKSRFLNAIRQSLVEGKDVNAVITFSKTSSEMLNAARSHTKNELIDEWVSDCCEVADAFREGTLGKVYFNFPKQTESEFEDGEFFVEVK